ncbi:hypothetical protein LCER1_G006850 [Lachnellula cervina]|uniref:Uncharacterized protein n=1 Tax=Lachnellula cervina TaxID=1316786 RepID=A0A7D8UWW0_9HELO|nr:hypothetical protein LCER1_G006850 [Lachnellula cervina]
MANINSYRSGKLDKADEAEVPAPGEYSDDSDHRDIVYSQLLKIALRFYQLLLFQSVNMQRPENPSAPVTCKVSEKSPAKVAHVNMMTDTIIANMPPEGLRTVLRGLLGVDPKVTLKLNALATEYLAATRPAVTP